MTAVNTLIQMIVNSVSAPATLLSAFPSFGACVLLFLIAAVWLLSGFLTLRPNRPALTFVFGLILPVVAPLLTFLCERGFSFRKAQAVPADIPLANPEDVAEAANPAAPQAPTQDTFRELHETNAGARIRLVDGTEIVAASVADAMEKLCVLTLENGQTVRMPYAKMESIVKQ